MAEYIDREALRDALYDADAILMSGIKILNAFPAADVAPVRHGRVETVTDRFMVMYQRCSECDAELEWKAYPNYCPNCGAKMRGSDDE